MYLGSDAGWPQPEEDAICYVKYNNGRYSIATYDMTHTWFDHFEQRSVVVDGDRPFIVAYAPWESVVQVLEAA